MGSNLWFRSCYVVMEVVLPLSFVEPHKQDRPDNPNKPEESSARHAEAFSDPERLSACLSGRQGCESICLMR